jgi:hypothetical protein
MLTRTCIDNLTLTAAALDVRPRVSSGGYALSGLENGLAEFPGRLPWADDSLRLWRAEVIRKALYQGALIENFVAASSSKSMAAKLRYALCSNGLMSS